VKYPAILLLAIGLASCAAPKAIVIAEAPMKKETAAADPASQPKQANLPADDGMRLPEDLLALPADNQLRSVAAEPKDGDATVIARPPKD
jgi:hypothetical protein